MKSILGYSPDFLYENPWLWNKSIHPDERDVVAEGIKDFASGKDLKVEYRIKDSSGNWRWFHDRSIGKYVEGEEIIIEGISIDITDHKRAEEALKKEKDRAQRYLDIAGVMLVAINTDQEVILINRKGCEILGYKEEEIIGRNWFDHFIPEPDRNSVKAVFSKLVAAEIEPVEHFENSVLTKSGMEKIIAWHNTIITDEKGRITGTLSSGEDITERKRAEKTLQESENRYRQVVENATEIIYTVDEKGNFTYANRAGLKVIGYSLGELRKLNYADLVVPGHRERVSQVYINQFRGRLPTTYVEFPFFGKGGEIIWFGQNSTLVMDGDKIVGFHIIARDITKRKGAEEALRESEQRYRNLVETAPDVIYTLAPDGTVTSLNPVFERITGWPQSAVVGQTIYLHTPS